MLGKKMIEILTNFEKGLDFALFSVYNINV